MIFTKNLQKWEGNYCQQYYQTSTKVRLKRTDENQVTNLRTWSRTDKSKKQRIKISKVNLSG